MWAVKFLGEAKQNNSPHEIGEPIDGCVPVNNYFSRLSGRTLAVNLAPDLFPHSVTAVWRGAGVALSDHRQPLGQM
jgi:hypothetical protein